MTPAIAGDVLTKCKEEDVMEAQQKNTYRSGTGKLMHIMQHSWPEVHNCVQNQARHMGRSGKKHMKAILRCMKYIVWTGPIMGWYYNQMCFGMSIWRHHSLCPVDLILTMRKSQSLVGVYQVVMLCWMAHLLDYKAPHRRQWHYQLQR